MDQAEPIFLKLDGHSLPKPWVSCLFKTSIDLPTGKRVKKSQRLPCKMARGDEAPEVEDDEFRRIMHAITTDFLEEKIADEAVYKQYQRFYTEQETFQRLSVCQHRTNELDKIEEKFSKDLSLYGDRKTVVIGLEDVLLTVETVPMEDFDREIEIQQGEVSLGTIYVKFRPFLLEFLDFISGMFELIVFCTGSELYCSAILDYIEQERKYFAHRVYNDHVLLENPSYAIKDYNFLFTKGRTEDNTIIVDCSVGAFCLKLGNGVVVERFVSRAQANDLNELAALAKYLEDLNSKPSVCKFIKSTTAKATASSI